jgi:hypothetical protein
MPVCAVVLDAMSPPSDVLVVLRGRVLVGHVVGQRNRKECRARGGKRGLVAVARRRLPALLRLGWGLGGRRRGRALVARTDFSPLDIAH